MQNVDYYENKEFQDKVKFYLIKASIAIMNEPVSVPHHILRCQFATRILQSNFMITTYALGVMTNTTIKAHIDAGTNYDADIEFVVNSLFTAYAGGANITE